MALSTKPTNPKDAVGIGKVPLSTVPSEVIAEVGLGLFEGARKYGRHNYRMPQLGVRGSVYYDATMRHLMAWWEGEDIDPDSGLSHVTKAIASLFVLRDAMIQSNWNDDRPPPSPEGWMTDLNTKATALLEKYPNPKEAYTHDRVPRSSNQAAQVVQKAEPHSEGPTEAGLPTEDSTGEYPGSALPARGFGRVAR